MKLSHWYLKQWKENYFTYIMTPAMILKLDIWPGVNS